MSNPVPGQAPPGWYADPGNADQQRYWNGAAWTDNVAPRYIYGAPPAQPVSPPPPQGPPIVMRGPQPLGPGGQPYASFARRLSGYLIDMVVLLPVGIIVMLVVGWPSVARLVDCIDNLGPSQNDIAQRAFQACVESAFDPTSLVWASVLLSVVQLAYFTILLSTWGRTVGGQALGLRCVTADGRRPTLVKAFVRSVIPFGFGLLGAIPAIGIVATVVQLVAYLAMLWSPKRQTWMDQAAGTFVVKVP